MSERLRLSVLELAPVGEGREPADALAASVELARLAERLGFHRLWVAEHHSMPGIASSAPPVLIAHLAAATTHLRIGSGGVMLPNHSPLVVAEQFGMLEALHPGRIDLGLGRAPGTDGVTAHALRRGATREQEFSQDLAELLAHFDGTFPADHPYSRIVATPARGYRPAIWLLGSSDYSAQLAGYLGLPFSFAHHFAGDHTRAALELYRQCFRPSEVLAEPYSMIGVNVMCAPSTDEAQFLAGPGALAIVRLRLGTPGRYPTPQEAAAHEYTPMERSIVEGWTRHHVVGDPAEVHTRLRELAEEMSVDELMVTTTTHDPADRLRSFELLAPLVEPAPETEVAGVGDTG